MTSKSTNSNRTKSSAPSELLTPEEFAATAKVSVAWLAKARKRGDGPPYIKFGRLIRYYPIQVPK